MKENGKITTNEIFLLSSAVVNNNISTRKKDNKFDTTTNTLHLAQHRRSPFFSLTHSHSFFSFHKIRISVRYRVPESATTPLRLRYDLPTTTCRFRRRPRRGQEQDDDKEEEEEEEATAAAFILDSQHQRGETRANKASIRETLTGDKSGT